MGFGQTDSYRIVNPSAGTYYVDKDGNAITLSTQPKVDGGVMIVGTGGDLRTGEYAFGGVALGSTETEIYGSQVIREASQRDSFALS